MDHGSDNGEAMPTLTIAEQPTLSMPLTYSANARGYAVVYRGEPIGGAGITASARGPRGAQVQKQIAAYAEMAKREIEGLNAGRGRIDYFANIVKLWLAHFGHKDLEAVKVKFGDHEAWYAGSRYVSTHGNDNDPRICIRATNGEWLSKRKAYVMDDGSTWYVAGYALPETVASETGAKHNEIGCTVVLCRWPHEDAIDKYEARPYKRIQMSVSKA